MFNTFAICDPIGKLLSFCFIFFAYMCVLRLSREKQSERDSEAASIRNKPGSAQVGATSKAQKCSRNIFLKVAQSKKNLKRCHLGSLNVFRNQKHQTNATRYPLIELDNFQKNRIVLKKNENLASTFGSIKNLWFSALVRESNARSPASQKFI